MPTSPSTTNLAVRHVLADAVEPFARVFDPDLPWIAHTQAEDIADRDARARRLQLDTRDLGRGLAGEPMRNEWRQIEPLLGRLAQGEHQRLHGSSSFRWKWCGPSLPP